MTKSPTKDRARSADATEREAYCGRLGHFVPFRYCLHPAQDEPCSRILDCWWQVFDVAAYLQRELPEKAFSKLLAAGTPPNRLETIFTIVSRVTEKGEGDEKEGGRP